MPVHPAVPRRGRRSSPLAHVAWAVTVAVSATGCGADVHGPSGDDGSNVDSRDGGKSDGTQGGNNPHSCSEPKWADETWLRDSKCYYVVDVKALYFNNWCYRVDACEEGLPPNGKTVDEMIENHDRLAFLTSLQGLVNRQRPSMYLIAEAKPDEEWLRLLAEEDIWLTDMRRTDLATFDEVLEVFGDHPAVTGAARWAETEPFTMNIAYSLAGAEDLVVVRQGSAIEDVVTDHFPVKQDLVGRFASKRAAYEWLISDYLATGKLAPTLALYPDGWRILVAKTFVYLSSGDSLMPRDYTVANRQMVISYGVHPESPDPTQAGNHVGEGRAVLSAAFQAIRGRVGPGKVFEAGGWPGSEYSFDCNDDGVVNQVDHVSCEEWEWVEFVSRAGGVERMGLTSAYAKEAANTSFFKHGPGTDLMVQPPPLTPAQLLQRRHAFGPPRDHSFELDGSAWTFDATNRAIYTQPANAKRGSRFLQMNVTPADLGKGLRQTVPLGLTQGQHYRFVIHGRSASGAEVMGRQRVTANNGAVVLCNEPFVLAGEGWKELTCDFQVVSAGLSNPRLEVALDSANQNFAFDEAYFLGSTTMELNPSRKFALFFMGDYDFANAMVIVPVGVHPFTWSTRGEATMPTAWGMAADASTSVPPIFAYFAKTRTENQTFVMPDSGAGYLNPGYLPDAVVPDWVAESTSYHRRFGYRSGWVLNGKGTYDVPADNAAGNKIRAMYRKIAPDGIYYNARAQDAQLLEGGLAVLPMEGGNLAAGVSAAAAIDGVHDALNRSSSRFNVFRAVFMADKAVEAALKGVQARGVDVAALDPSTFFALYRQSRGEATRNRLSVVGHDVPSTMQAGASVGVTVRVRNDGWDAWVSKPADRSDCDGSGTAGKGCERLAWGLSAGPVVATGLGAAPSFPYGGRGNFPSVVFPGDIVDVSFELKAPTEPGTYTFQVDGVKEAYRFFETAGNVPWQKTIVVK